MFPKGNEAVRLRLLRPSVLRYSTWDCGNFQAQIDERGRRQEKKGQRPHEAEVLATKANSYIVPGFVFCIRQKDSYRVTRSLVKQLAGKNRSLSSQVYILLKHIRIDIALGGY